jgi:hypothetical protein
MRVDIFKQATNTSFHIVSNVSFSLTSHIRYRAVGKASFNTMYLMFRYDTA